MSLEIPNELFTSTQLAEIVKCFQRGCKNLAADQTDPSRGIRTAGIFYNVPVK